MTHIAHAARRVQLPRKRNSFTIIAVAVTYLTYYSVFGAVFRLACISGAKNVRA